MKILKHIYLDKTFLFFLLIIIFTGNFNSFILYFSLLLIHELGHTLTGVLLGYKLVKISFYPYGGITSFDIPLNIPLKKELLILIMGPIMQIIGYLLLKNNYPNIRIYHYTLLIFNLLPIYPMDGGRIVYVLLGYFFCYLKSFLITFYISILSIIVTIIYYQINLNINALCTLMVLFYKLISVYRKRNYYYNRFLLERFLYQFPFKKIKIIDNERLFYRDKIHYIYYEKESNFLKKYFQLKK